MTISRKRIRTSLLRAGTALAAALAAQPATAQTRTDAAKEPIPEIVVIGTRQNQFRLPGSAAAIDARTLARSQVFSVNEALRKVPGVLPREEEGAGLRPNIGLRGLNPTRSTKVLLLEDGLPLTYAPYGDNASYFHPSLERYERIEVLKGSGQIAFGPQTVGGVINYITPTPPRETAGFLQLRAGNRDYHEILGNVGGTFGATGLVLNALSRATDGSRENLHFRVDDLSAKVVQDLGDRHSLTLKLSWFREDSRITYSGLTAAEYAANPRQNPFANDHFAIDRVGTSLVHRFDITEATALTTGVYGAWFHRDWWRQSSNSTQRPNDASDPACGGMANLDTTCGNEGRLREYLTGGVETRLTTRFALGDVDNELQAGARLHAEDQSRRQVNGDSPTARTPGRSVNGGIVEDNRRETTAWSGFVENRIGFGAFALKPGVRVEHVEFARENRLNGRTGTADLTEIIPGIGATYELSPVTTLFAGVHRGFAPPRVEDIITNAGGAVELEAEKSWNREIGLRSRPAEGLTLEVTAFRMDFANQIVPASVAGGAGATLTSAGKTRHQGLEGSFRLDSAALFDTGPHGVTLSGAWTWVVDSEFRGERFSSLAAFRTVRVTGNRLPYSPEHLGSLALGYAHEGGFDGQVEAVYTGAMFTDDINSVPVSADGQRGRIDANTVVNLAVGYQVPGTGLKLMGTVKNLFDRTYVVDRSRGTIPGNPRLFQAGLRYSF